MNQEELNKQLLVAVGDDDIDAAKTAIEKGAKVNARDEYGETSLHEAARNGRTDIVDLLKQHGETK